jgi:hypothetical protein
MKLNMSPAFFYFHYSKKSSIPCMKATKKFERKTGYHRYWNLYKDNKTTMSKVESE